MLLEKIEKYVADYDVIPVKKEIYADLVTPIALLQKIAAKKKRFYLLESVEGGETLFFPWVRSGHEGILLSG